MPSYVEQLAADKERIRAVVTKEKAVLHLDKITKPSKIEELFNFDFSHIDQLADNELERYVGCLSQHLIYANKYVNQLRIVVSMTKKFLNNVLDIEALTEDGKTAKERETKARLRVADIGIIEREALEEETRLAVYDNTIEQLTQHLQTLKKVYDARIKEKSSTNLGNN